MINITPLNEVHYSLLKNTPKAIDLTSELASSWHSSPITIISQKQPYALRSSKHINMKYATVEDIIASFPHPILPTVQGDPDYLKNQAIRKLLQVNARSIDTHLGGGDLGHLGLVVSDASYAIVDPATEAGPTLWIIPTAPWWAPVNTDGIAAQISAARHSWDEALHTYHTYTSVQQAIKKQIITVFEPIFWSFKRRHGRLCKHHSSVNAGPPIHVLWKHHGCGFRKKLRTNALRMRPSSTW
jgi:hypothetical protein